MSLLTRKILVRSVQAAEKINDPLAQTFLVLLHKLLQLALCYKRCVYYIREMAQSGRAIKSPKVRTTRTRRISRTEAEKYQRLKRRWEIIRVPASLKRRLEAILETLENAYSEGRIRVPDRYADRIPLHYALSRAVKEYEEHLERSKTKHRGNGKGEE